MSAPALADGNEQKIKYDATFTLKDADGADHRYDVIGLNPTTGMEIAFKLGGLVSGGIVGLLAAALEDEPEGGPAAADDGGILGNAALMKAIAKLDLSKMGPELRGALMHPGNGALVMEILHGTNRDGAPVWLNTHFQRAYKMNYQELMWAVLKVIEVNRLFPLPASS